MYIFSGTYSEPEDDETFQNCHPAILKLGSKFDADFMALKLGQMFDIQAAVFSKHAIEDCKQTYYII